MNIASYSTGFSAAKVLYAWATRLNASSGPPAPPRAVPQGFGELAETLQCDGLDDVFHRCEVLVEHRLAVLDLGGQPTGGDRIPALALGKGAGRCDDESATGSAITEPTVCDGHAVRVAPLSMRAPLLTSAARRVSVASTIANLRSEFDMDTNEQHLAETYLVMLNTHEPDLVDRFVAEDYRNHNAFVADGREANRQFWTAFFTALPDLSATMEDLVISGDRVVGRFVYRGTHTGEFMGIPASGNPVEMRSIDIWRVEDGMFVEHWDELNLLEMFQQMGVTTAPGRRP